MLESRIFGQETAHLVDGSLVQAPGVTSESTQGYMSNVGTDICPVLGLTFLWPVTWPGTYTLDSYHSSRLETLPNGGYIQTDADKGPGRTMSRPGLHSPSLGYRADEACLARPT